MPVRDMALAVSFEGLTQHYQSTNSYPIKKKQVRCFLFVLLESTVEPENVSLPTNFPVILIRRMSQ